MEKQFRADELTIFDLRPQYHQVEEPSEGYISAICDAVGIFRKTGYHWENRLDSIKRLIKFFL